VGSNVRYKIEKLEHEVFRIVRHVEMTDVLWQGNATWDDVLRLVRQIKDWKSGTVSPDASTVQLIADRLLLDRQG
jgi:hypothetical protein